DQVGVVRRLGGLRALSVRAVTGAWDKARPMDGAYAALLTFENTVSATLTYSGYGHFDSDELQNWVGEMGQQKQPGGRARKIFANAAEEAAYKHSTNYGGENYRPAETTPPAPPNFGTVIVSCERADLRPLPNGVMIYRDGEAKLDALPAPAIPRVEVIDELYAAVVGGVAPRHGGAWAMATLEICLAILQSNREQRE